MRTGDVTQGMMSVQTVTRNEREMLGFQRSILLFPTGGDHKVSKIYPRSQAAACNFSHTSVNQNLKQTHMSTEGYIDSRPSSQWQKFRLSSSSPPWEAPRERELLPQQCFWIPGGCTVQSMLPIQRSSSCFADAWAPASGHTSSCPLSTGCQETQPQWCPNANCF